MSAFALSEQSSCAWFCPLLDKSGQRLILARDGLSAYDPTATLAVHCGNGFTAGFSPYQSARLLGSRARLLVTVDPRPPKTTVTTDAILEYSNTRLSGRRG